VVETKTWSPVWSSKQRLYDTGEISETVTHQEEPAKRATNRVVCYTSF